MEFDLVRPCPKCPFRTDCLEGWLGRARAIEIVEAITVKDQTFACHQTTEHDDETGEHVPCADEQHCAGALIMLEHHGEVPQLARIAQRLGKWDPDKMDFEHSHVFLSPSDFVEHHTPPDERPEEVECCSIVDAECLAPAGFAVGSGVMDNYDVDPEDIEYCDKCGSPVCKNCTCWCYKTEEE